MTEKLHNGALVRTSVQANLLFLSLLLTKFHLAWPFNSSHPLLMSSMPCLRACICFFSSPLCFCFLSFFYLCHFSNDTSWDASFSSSTCSMEWYCHLSLPLPCPNPSFLLPFFPYSLFPPPLHSLSLPSFSLLFFSFCSTSSLSLKYEYTHTHIYIHRYIHTIYNFFCLILQLDL